ncbi:MAG: hypothetical protein N838_02790 [Thiohalocapsa sp. PB-PSB1]|nr:MAG: hypothetical protein N838_31365 [Thiohalocapsa sp. PB-PSB1]QQO52461.1 MAG: hypothetical protein N838_02790 [Thiohalocapsa sp. PB-PSB1]
MVASEIYGLMWSVDGDSRASARDQLPALRRQRGRPCPPRAMPKRERLRVRTLAHGRVASAA